MSNSPYFGERFNVGGRPASGAGSEEDRNLVVPRESFEQLFLLCPVCKEKFDLDLKAPKRLPCNHSVCLTCLIQLVDCSQSGFIKCPECRYEMSINGNWSHQLPNDHRIVQMLDFISQATTAPQPQTVVTSQNMCSRHDQQELNFFCQTCLAPVCRDCLVVDHNQVRGHEIIEMKTAWKKHSPLLDEMQTRGRRFLERMKIKSDALANASTKVDLDEAQLETEISQMFSKYRDALARREEELLREVHSLVLERKTHINARYSTVCNFSAQFQSLLDMFTSSREGKNIVEVFTMKKLMEEQELELMQLICDDQDGMLCPTKFSLKMSDEENFLSEMRRLGQICSDYNKDDSDQTWIEVTVPSSNFKYDVPSPFRADKRPFRRLLSSRKAVDK